MTTTTGVVPGSKPVSQSANCVGPAWALGRRHISESHAIANMGAGGQHFCLSCAPK